ncbi:MAG: chemotaxis protein CheW [Lachnospiraceae bacterium]
MYENTFSNDKAKHLEICKYLTFWCNQNIYAVSTFDVLQIMEMTHITPIPDSPSYVRGILHLRGHNVPILDLGLRLHEAPAEQSKTARIVILSTKEGDLGLIVESIGEIVDLSSLDIEDVPKLAVSMGKRTLNAVAIHDGTLIPILDIITLLSDDAISSIDLSQD